jgi:2-furoyl-CoA dehydrogenase large subunit
VTSKTPTGLVRGFGGPQVYYALERLMDRIAVELGDGHRSPCASATSCRPQQFPYHRGSGRGARFR